MQNSEPAAGHAARSHSSIVGGSNAARRIACPGSYRLEQKVPDAMKNKSSVFADEGTAMHEAMEWLLRNNATTAQAVAGREFNGFVMTADLVDEGLQPALDYFDTLLDRLTTEDGPEIDIYLETKVEVPGVPEATGTVDILMKTPKRSVVLDWKFGVGKPVYITELATGKPNSQLRFYGRGGMHTTPNAFSTAKDWPVELHIVQPRVRGRDPDSPAGYSVTVTVADLESFRMELVKAIAEALGDRPTTSPGDHCAFAACRAVCPHHTGALLDMAKLGVAKPKAETLQALLPDMLDLADLAEDAISALRQYAHNFLEAGHSLAGWKLVDKRAMRKWADAAEAEATLRGAGLTEDDLFARELRSPAQVEKVLKKMKQTLPEDLIVAVSSGMTLARSADKRPDVTPLAGRMMELGQKIAALAGR